MSDTIKISIDPKASYAIEFDAFGELDELHFDGKTLTRMLVDMNGSSPSNKLEEIQHELRQIYSALSRAAEDGDQLKVGIILGQTLVKLSMLMYK